MEGLNSNTVTDYKAAYTSHMTWLHRLKTQSDAAESGIKRQLEAAKRNLDGAQKAAAEGEAGARNRLPTAALAVREAEKNVEAWYFVNATLELIIAKSISEEKRSGLPPTILEWIDDVSPRVPS